MMYMVFIKETATNGYFACCNPISLHDALPICGLQGHFQGGECRNRLAAVRLRRLCPALLVGFFVPSHRNIACRIRAVGACDGMDAGGRATHGAVAGSDLPPRRPTESC